MQSVLPEPSARPTVESLALEKAGGDNSLLHRVDSKTIIVLNYPGQARAWQLLERRTARAAARAAAPAKVKTKVAKAKKGTRPAPQVQFSG